MMYIDLDDPAVRKAAWEHVRMLTMYPMKRTVQSYIAPDGTTRYLLADSRYTGYIGLEPKKPVTWPGWTGNPNTGVPARVVTQTLEQMALLVETFATHGEAQSVLEQIATDIAAQYANDVWYSVANQRVADNPVLHPYEDIMLHTLWLPGTVYTFEDKWHWVALEPSLGRLVQWGVEMQQIAALMAL